MIRPGLAARRALRGTTPQFVVLLLLAGLATAWTVDQARSMGAMPGAMGLGLPAFVLMWTVMMTAMMLPSVAPLGSLYARTIQSPRAARLALFILGYLLVWGASGVPAFGLAWLSGEIAGNGSLGVVIAVTVFGVAGIYQLTPLKSLCLTHCRSPLSHVLHYSSFRGRMRDLKAGMHNGYYCFGCCWSLMVLMVAFGVMNVYGMVALAGVVAGEKLTPAGDRFSRAVGVGLLVLAIAVIWIPELAPGLTDTASMGDMAMAGTGTGAS